MEFDRRPSSRLLFLPVYVVASLLFVGVTASVFLKIDRVVRGRGVLVPPNNSVRVTTLRAGAVTDILVKDGDLVKKGQPIIRLEAAEDDAAVKSLTVQIAAMKRELVQREELMVAKRNVAELKARLIAGDLASEKSGIEAQHANIEQLKRELTDWQSELERQTRLAAQKYTTLSAVEAARRQADQNRTKQVEALTTLAQKKLSIEKLKQQEAGTALEFAAEQIQEELALEQGRRTLAGLEQQLAAATLQQARATVVAPATGLVHDMAVRSEGEYVGNAQVVCRVAPQKQGWMAEIELPAADVGFVRIGQRARVKIDAFPFEDYGVVSGTIEFVAPDAKPTAPGQLERKPVYAVRVRLDDKAFLARQSESLELRGGMTLIGELVNRRETIAAFVLRPLRKAGDKIVR
jgi:multidrug efflux pump subunit AcrA (membrane-fusion protein)